LDPNQGDPVILNNSLNYFIQVFIEDMNPCGLRPHNGMYQWWHERFMNAFYGIQEPRHLSWAETPQMWLAGYREKEKGHEE
jgi:hypothetical protein